jgi:hypothetical protein
MEGLERLFSRINLERPELRAVKEAYRRGDTAAGLSALVSHFRRRTTPLYMFDEKDLTHFRDKETIGEAEEICAHRILGFDLGPEIDWRRNASEQTWRDSEWMWSLARHLWWVTLGRAYQMTGEEKYAREWVAQLKGWHRAWPVEEFLGKLGTFGEKTDMNYPGDAWRTIETGIRMYCVWLPLFFYFRKCDAWDEEGWVCYLNSIHDHGELLSTHYSNHWRCSNWLTMECSALFQLGVFFPEFRQASQWQRLGYRRVTHEVKYQFDSFGVHMERTPIYHLTAAGAFLQAYRMAVLNGLPVPPYMLSTLERSAEYLMRLIKPDFTTPMFGDADRNSLLAPRRADVSPFEGMNNTTDPFDLNELRAFFRIMAELTDREDFRWLSTGRRKGRPPAENSSCMADAGFYVFRTGWASDDSCVMVTGINLERGENNAHAHYDAGHLELQIAGEDILVDTGRYVYRNSGLKEWRNYFHSTSAHNTIQVDRHEMGTVPDTTPNIRTVRTFCHSFESTESYDAVEVSHNGYAFMEEPVFHLRRVIFLKPCLWVVDDMLTGFGLHEYRLFFNFAPGTLTPIAERPGAYRFTPRSVEVEVTPLLTEGLSSEVVEGSEDPIGGWVSYGYTTKAAAPRLMYMKRGEVPVRFLTVVTQSGKGADLRLVSTEDSSIQLEAGVSGRRFALVLEAGDFAVRQESPSTPSRQRRR